MEVRFHIGETSDFKTNGKDKGQTGSLKSVEPLVRPLWRTGGSGATAPPLAARLDILRVFATLYNLYLSNDHFYCQYMDGPQRDVTNDSAALAVDKKPACYVHRNSLILQRAVTNDRNRFGGSKMLIYHVSMSNVIFFFWGVIAEARHE